MKKTDILSMALCAVFAALSAALSQVSIPIGPVPINLAHVSIFMAAGLLGAKYGTVSQIVFVLLGAVGAPVFSGFSGGFSVILGPTGGFIIGYIACAFVVGYLIERFGQSLPVLFAAMYAGWLVTYVPGLIWFMITMKTDLVTALWMCCIPFLLGDLAKTVVCAVLINRLGPVLSRAAGRAA